VSINEQQVSAFAIPRALGDPQLIAGIGRVLLGGVRLPRTESLSTKYLINIRFRRNFAVGARLGGRPFATQSEIRGAIGFAARNRP
jgi:hypothetical protein